MRVSLRALAPVRRLRRLYPRSILCGRTRAAEGTRRGAGVRPGATSGVLNPRRAAARPAAPQYLTC